MSERTEVRLDRAQQARSVALAVAVPAAILIADGGAPTVKEIKTIAASLAAFILHGESESAESEVTP